MARIFSWLTFFQGSQNYLSHFLSIFDGIVANYKSVSADKVVNSTIKDT
jgi:hypothetical protein